MHEGLREKRDYLFSLFLDQRADFPRKWAARLTKGNRPLLERILESYCVVIFDDRFSPPSLSLSLSLLLACKRTHVHAARSARTPPRQESIDIPDWAKIQPGTP